MSYTVIVCGVFRAGDGPGHAFEVPGFPTRETAVEYARRRLRKPVEEQREAARSPEELRHRWHAFGEDCRVVGTDGVVYRASSELDRFLRHPATPDECDYRSRCESLLPDVFALVCNWAAGAVSPPRRHECRIGLRSEDPPASAVETGEMPLRSGYGES